MPNQSLEDRVAALERSLRRWRTVGLVVVTLFGVRATVSTVSALDEYITVGFLRAYTGIETSKARIDALTATTITVTEAVRVVDKDGKVRASLGFDGMLGSGDPSLKLVDATREKHASLTVGSDTVGLSLWTGKDSPSAYLYASTSRWMPAGLDLGTSVDGKRPISLEVKPLGEKDTYPVLHLVGGDNASVYLSTPSWGGELTTTSPFGSISLDNNPMTKEPVLRVRSRGDGKGELYFGLERGEPVARVTDGGGKVTWSANDKAAAPGKAKTPVKGTKRARSPEDNL